jgi:hypothetical protein
MRSSRGWATIAIGIAAIAAFAECTGEDPDVDTPVDAGPGDTSTTPTNDATSGDTGPSTDGGGDGAVDAGRCNPTLPFGSIEIVPVTTTGGLSFVAGGRLSPDELTLYFSSLGPTGGAAEIRESTRAGTAPFASQQLVTQLNTMHNDDRPTFTTDLRNVIFDSNRPDGGGVAHLWRAERSVVPGNFGTPFELTNANVNVNNERDPYLIGDGRTLYWTSVRELNPPRIFRAAGVAPFEWGTVGPVPVVNFSDGDGDANLAPVLTPDERIIYFAHGPISSQSNWEIWRATRGNANDTFSQPQKVAELSHPALDAPTWVSADDCVIYFVSTRGADGGIVDAAAPTAIFSARRPPP